MTDPTQENDPYQELLQRFPPEQLIDKDDAAYPQTEAFGGCLTCAQGTPCRTRMDADVREILTIAQLPDSARAVCLVWLIEQDYNHLTHSFDEMAGQLRAALRLVIERNGKDLQTVAYDPALPLSKLLESVCGEAATRLNTPLSDISLRFVIESETGRSAQPRMVNAA